MKRLNIGLLDIVHRSFILLLSGLTVYGTIGIGYLVYKRREKLRNIEDQIHKGILPATPDQAPVSHSKRQ